MTRYSPASSFESDDLYCKSRYNIHHGGTDLKWRLFVKNGQQQEVMHLCRQIYCYVPQRTYEEIIEGVGHYSLLAKANQIVIDDNLIAWGT